MIYTDGVHLIGDTVEQLHSFAKSIGLKRHFFEGVKKGHPHYDLTNDKIKLKALDAGAVEVTTRWIVKFFNDIPHHAANSM